MTTPAPPLSARTQQALKRGAESPLSTALFKTFGNQYSNSNPQGVVNAGLAENSLMHDCALSLPSLNGLRAFWGRTGVMQLAHTDLTYGTSILGSDRLFSSLSSHYSRYFAPVAPVESAHIATSNGMSSMLEHLATVISDERDGWLLPTPWYNGFKGDLEATARIEIVSVEIEMGQEGELEEVATLEREMQRRKDEGITQRITAVLVTNPHNPLGFCYKRETLLEYARFAERWNLFLVCDEIYALSVFASDSPTSRPFTSILSLDVKAEAQCNPARVIQLYGLSKDFGANGLRGANLVCQHNLSILSGLTTTAMMMRMGSPTAVLWSALLESDELEWYVEENQKRLARGYKFLTTWLNAHEIPFTPSNAGHFLLADFSHLVKRVVIQSENQDCEQIGTQEEVELLNRLVDEGVYLGPGFSYAVTKPGYYRISFSIQPRELTIALTRIETVCQLPSTANQLALDHDYGCA
ncbi:uncharacterized protein JCM15063_001326 [Sporobolomyces koalae]|uniref:uncharacterized protein n=1 Tax=Sporobolomyces koalae TaxID=500713 RepID=UPI00316C986C